MGKEKEGGSSVTAHSRADTDKDVRNALLDQDNGSQPTALSLMVIMGNTILKEERVSIASSVIPLCSPSIHSCYIRAVLEATTLHSLYS